MLTEALRFCFDIRSILLFEEKLIPAAARRLIDAFLAGDLPSATPWLAPDATFHSPIRDYIGVEKIDAVWRAVAGVVQNAEPMSVHEHGRETIAFFAATIKDQPVDGVLRTLTDEHNRVSDLTLMIRPWAALKAGIAHLSTDPRTTQVVQ